MTDSPRRRWLETAFWLVAGGEALFLLAWLVNFATTPPSGEFAGLAAFGLFVIACVLGVIMLIFALVRNRVVRGIALVLVVIPPLSFAIEFAGIFVTTPSDEALEAGHGYFSGSADRALADAIVAGDARKVAELAPAANLNATGYDRMTLLRLALEQGHANPAVVAALLKAGADPDQDQQVLFGYMTSSSQAGSVMIEGKNEILLRAVIDAGVDLNQLDRDGRPRFFSALKWPEGLALTLDHGANTEAEDKEGATAIMWAVRLWYWPAIDVLLAHGAHLDHRDHDGHDLNDAVREKMDRFRNDKGGPPPQLAALAERLR